MRMIRSRVLLASFLAVLGSSATAADAQVPVDVELVFAIDISGSINYDEATVQRDGVAAAARSQEFIAGIQAGPLGSIAVAVLGYADERDSRLLMDWRILRGTADADAFAGELLSSLWMPGRRTSMGGGMEIAARSVETNGFDGRRKLILFFGDGKNNFGRPLAVVRDEVVARGIAIAGLPVMTGPTARNPYQDNSPADLDRYFASCVAAGEGAFVLSIRTAQDVVVAARQALAPASRDPNAAFIFDQLGTGRECDTWNARPLAR
jgi:hypothetical protein